MKDERNNKTARLVLLEDAGQPSEIFTFFEDGIGGGVETVVGFCLQVYHIMLFNQAKILFCDESFAEISDEYLPAFMEFLRQLSEKHKFIFVLISHDIRLLPYANKKFAVNKGDLRVVK